MRSHLVSDTEHPYAPKAKRKLRLSDSGQGWVELTSSYDEALLNAIKESPGVKWDGISKVWRIPNDLVNQIGTWAVNHGWEIINARSLPRCEHLVSPNGLHPYQAEGAQNAVDLKRYMLNYEMGLGKTASAVRALAAVGCQTTIVVVPALVRLVWAKELVKWWPAGCDSPTVKLIHNGEAAESGIIQGGITVVSYELLKKLNVSSPPTCLIVDESHYLKTATAQRTKAAMALVRLHNPKYVWFLSGTPVMTEPQDLWQQLELLFPSRFGNWFQFTRRYCGLVPNKHAKSGFTVKGVNDSTASELAARLAYVSARVTKWDVAHLLPPCLVQPIWLDCKGSMAPLDNEAGSEVLATSKVGAIKELVENAFEQGAPRVAVLCYYHSTAKLFAEELAGDVPVTVVTGDIPLPQRLLLLENLKSQKGIAILTMAAVNVGIDLTAFSTAVIGELYSQPALVTQALGRFSRLSGTVPSTVYIPLAQGSSDEKVMYALSKRLDAQAKLYSPGMSEAQLQKAVSMELTDDQLEQGIDRALEGV